MKRNKHQPVPNEPPRTFMSRPWVVGGVANLLIWASFPPLGWFPLAWIAGIAWAMLASDKRPLQRRSYWAIWAVSAVTWAILLEGVGRAFWANYIGLVFIGSYLAIYQVLFVWLTRVAINRWKVSIIVTAPAVWTGLEFVRGYMITGFSMALLGHTQVRLIPLIQLADVCGAYGVSFLVMFVGACVARALPNNERPWSWWPAVAAAGAVILTIVYGQSRITTIDSMPPERSLKVALLQGTEDTVLDPETAEQTASDTFMQYWRLTGKVTEQHNDIDLIVWPEGVFSGNVPQLVTEGEVIVPPEANLSPQDVAKIITQRKRMFDDKTRGIARLVNPVQPDSATASHPTYLLVGGDAILLSGANQKNYNSAFFIHPDGNVAERYDKMHPVLIGEYVPFGEQFPWLYNLMPQPRGLSKGSQPKALVVNGVSLSPSICFEDTVPHLIRRQVRQLAESGHDPDALINLTNDGWFWGSAILDLQLSCAIFRAVELRRPMLIAANTGMTASIDSNGTVLDTLPRRQEGVVISEVPIAKRFSLYEQYGDLFAGICLLFCVLAGADGLRCCCRRPAIGSDSV